MPRTKQLNKNQLANIVTVSIRPGKLVRTSISEVLSICPNFSKTGNISGMKKLYYGKESLLVKAGAYIYNVSAYPEIYKLAN